MNKIQKENITSNFMIEFKQQQTYLVSACLVGLNTRYDGLVKKNKSCLKRLAGCHWIPFCPEQLGGLCTPRPSAQIIDGDGNDILQGNAKVICSSIINSNTIVDQEDLTPSSIEGNKFTKNDYKNVTDSFVHGAQQVLTLAEYFEVKCVFLKAHSPSCGISPKIGVTAALLKNRGFKLEEF